MNITNGQLWLAAAVLATQAIDPFAGKWKLDPSRSVLPDEMSITAAGPNTYTLKFVGGSPETIVADGQDHPGTTGTTVSITIEQPGLWKVVRKKDGHELLEAIWTLGADGQSLHDVFSTPKADGSLSTINLDYRRTAGRSGISGTWEGASSTIDPFELEIQPAADGLSIVNLDSHSTSYVHFDGKDHPNKDSSAFATARRIDQRTYEVMSKAQGKLIYTQRVWVTADGKTLTMSALPVDEKKPQVLVFTRE